MVREVLCTWVSTVLDRPDNKWWRGGVMCSARVAKASMVFPSMYLTRHTVHTL